MFTLSERCRTLRDDAMRGRAISPRISAQFHFWSHWGRMKLVPEPHENITVTAASLCALMRYSAPVIGEGELIVGYNFGDDGLNGDLTHDRQLFESAGFDSAQINWYYETAGESMSGYKLMPPDGDLTETQCQLISERAASNNLPRASVTDYHSVLGYKMLLENGFEGMLKKVDRFAGQNGGGGFYDALRMVCEAGCVFGERWADEAERIGRDDIARICRQVPRRPARGFREAIQSLWFAHILNTWEDGVIGANSLGRLDQILYPYYIHDIKTGEITENEAFELLCCLWIKLYQGYDVQQCCVGGRSETGVSEVNELSYMMLKVTEALGFVRDISVRFDKNTEKPFVRRALEVVAHMRKGVPFFFNDDVLIDALATHGISRVDAADYTQIGCVETVIPGKSNPHAVNSLCNTLKAMEYALGGGRSLMNPDLNPGLLTGDPRDFSSFEQFKRAVFVQLEHLLHETVNIAVDGMRTSERNSPKPIKSLFTEGCVESGRDFNARGAKYDYYQLMLLGIPNLADSLAAVRHFVYEKRKYTMAELIYQCENDFPDETIRLDLLRNAPKYGNDDDRADLLACEIMDFACDRIEEESQRTGRLFHAQPFTFLWMLDCGAATAATPDGRRRGEILAYSMSPMQGRDKNGFTALLNSLCKLPTRRAPGSASAIVELDPAIFKDENLDIFTGVLLAAAQRGLCNIQFNTVDEKTLRDAQLHPELHSNLAVRVSGFSQIFNYLGRDVQDHIIARTKHAML